MSERAPRREVGLKEADGKKDNERGKERQAHTQPSDASEHLNNLQSSVKHKNRIFNDNIKNKNNSQ